MFSLQKYLQGLVLAIASTSIVLGGASVVRAQTADGASGELKTITVINTAAKNLEQAQDLGFFAQYGLKLDIKHLQNGAQVLAALQGGSGQIGYADTYAGINAVAQGFKIVLVANNNSNDGVKPILVKDDSSIKEPADLVGKTIGLPPVPQHTVNTRGWLTTNGVDPETVKLLYTQGQPELPPALQNGAVDAIFSTFDVAYRYGFRIIGNGDTSQWSARGATSAAWWSTEPYAQDNKDVLEAFDNGLHAYYKWLATLAPERVAALNLQYTQVDWTGLAGGDSEKLANLAYVGGNQSGPLNFEATQSWYELGLKYASDKIKPDVDLHEVVYSSALLPEPSSDVPAAAAAFAAGQ